MSSASALLTLGASHIRVSQEREVLERAGRDFGGYARGRPWAVVFPKTTAELSRLVQIAAEAGVPLTARGTGGSQSGQSVARSGCTVDFAELARVGPLDAEARTITAEAGATFRQLVEACRGSGLLPRVMPLNLDLSVGGVLSAGGFGSTSHRHGLVATHVRSFELVLADGSIEQAGPAENRGLYDTVLCGLGRAGLIARATLELEPVAERTRTETLAYESFDHVLDDLVQLAGRAEVLHLEAFCAATFRGLTRLEDGRRMPLQTWSYGVQVTTEASTPTAHPDLHFQRSLHVDEDEPYAFASRYDLRFDAMRATGAWDLCHPWFEVLLPLEAAKIVVPEALRLLPPFFGDGHRLLVFAETDRPRAFGFPARGPVVGFAVLPIGIPRAYQDAALAVLERLDARCRALGGVRYPSGYLFEPPPPPPAITGKQFRVAANFSSCLEPDTSATE